MYLVPSDSSCITENALDQHIYTTTLTQMNGAVAIVVDLLYSTVGENYQLCYQFASLPAFNGFHRMYIQSASAL